MEIRGVNPFSLLCPIFSRISFFLGGGEEGGHGRELRYSPGDTRTTRKSKDICCKEDQTSLQELSVSEMFGNGTQKISISTSSISLDKN